MANEATTDDGFAQTDDDDATLEERLDTPMTRRNAMKAGGAAVATAAMLGAGVNPAAAEIDDSASIDFSHSAAHDPYIEGTVTVATHEGTFDELEYVADDDSTKSLTEHGIVLAEEVDADTPHNPVTLQASNFVTPEFTAFPRGATYDDDADSTTDEVDVSVLDAEHWTLTNATNGSISVTDGDGDSLVVSSSAVAAGETVKATFDLSTVASEDATITSGMARKFLQTVADVDSLPSGVVVEFAVIDSNATEVTATIDPAGDAGTVDVLSSVTGDSQVLEARVGELEDSQAVTLSDIQKLELRIKETDASLQLHGLNLERAERWQWGDQEFTNADGDLETQTVEGPAGSFSITSLSTLTAPFDSAEIRDVTFNVEMRASELPDDQIHVRVEDSPDAYDRPKQVEMVPEFEWPTAYSVTVNAGAAKDVVQLPQGRYLGAEVATGIADIDEWKDVEESISWTDKTSSYSSVDKKVELLASTSSSDRTGVRLRTIHSEEEATALTDGGSSSNDAVVVGGGSGAFSWLRTGLLGLIAAIGFWKRKAIGAVVKG